MSEPTREQRDMRVAIMRDVIERVQAPDRPNVRSGTYLLFVGNDSAISGDLQDLLPRIQPYCNVCMLGAAVLSFAALYDNVEAKHVIGQFQAEMHEALGVAFDRETLIAVECAFERDPRMGDEYNDECATDQTCAAAEFGWRFSSHVDRAVAIAQNIVDHDGDFRP